MVIDLTDWLLCELQNHNLVTSESSTFFPSFFPVPTLPEKLQPLIFNLVVLKGKPYEKHCFTPWEPPF